VDRAAIERAISAGSTTSATARSAVSAADNGSSSGSRWRSHRGPTCSCSTRAT
jgi:hypothetical protein